MMDEVVYALPLGMPSLFESMLHSGYVRPSLETIFDYRSRFYADFFEGRYGESEPAALRVVREVRS